MSWIDAIGLNRALVANTGQTGLAIIVSGSASDSAFWAATVDRIKRDILRQDGQVQLVSIPETQPLGNFLGTLNAWTEVERHTSPPSRDVSLLSMVFGRGKRLSPFTQALGNRKAAFPTPLKSTYGDTYLRTGDLATLYSNSWLEQLRARGFQGVLIKWGDEAVIPDSIWQAGGHDFNDVDLVRFVWKTQPTEVFAREKEWFLINEERGLIERLIPRQDLSSLLSVLREYEGRRYATAVNLGSVAASYTFLNLARPIFQDLLARGAVSADWDPYVFLLLLAADECSEAAAPAEARCPGLAAAIRELRSGILRKLGRPLRVSYLDFGEALWVDLGLHITLRKCLEALTAGDRVGNAMRALFGLPSSGDANGNIILGSRVPQAAQISNSVIVDSTIVDSNSVLNRSVVVGSRHNRLTMPSGGASLFSAVGSLQFHGAHGIAFRSIAGALEIAEGGRHTSFFPDDMHVPLISNEAVQTYNDDEYCRPILGNSLSFEEAANRAGSNPEQLESNWQKAWLNFRL